MRHEFPIEIQFQLKKTLITVFWYKDALLQFLQSCDVPKPLLDKARGTLRENSKRVAVDELIENLLILPDSQGFGPLRRMLQQLVKWSSFSTADSVEDARQCVIELARLVEEHDKKQKEKQTEIETRAKQVQIQNETVLQFQKREALCNRYAGLVLLSDPHRRGHEFENLLHDFFEFENLNPQEAFALKDEQIDGAFELDKVHYLVEAKWTQSKVEPKEVSWFQTKIERRMKGTRGLMISITGFTEGAIRTANDSKCIILMDGDDLYLTLDPRTNLTLQDLLRNKISGFSRRGTSFVSARDILNLRS
ncbi:MAG: restriction endonuclease [Chloroflexi bacterium]|nr:restriction endonuclease [Chloroflexota bacterium]